MATEDPLKTDPLLAAGQNDAAVGRLPSQQQEAPQQGRDLGAEDVEPVADPPNDAPLDESQSSELDQDPGDAPFVDDVTPEKTEAELELEAIVPQVDPIKRTLRDAKGNHLDVVQKELQYFAKMDFYGVLGRAVNAAMTGDNALEVTDLVEAAQLRQLMGDMDDEGMTPQKVLQASAFLGAIAKLASLAPEMMRECYLIWLNVPRKHRRWAMDSAFEEMSDEDGQAILRTFIDQNIGAIEDFFVRVLPKIVVRGMRVRELQSEDQ